MNEGRAWRIEVSSRAERELKRLPRESQARIRRAIDSLDPLLERGDIRKLQGRREQWRLRVGDHRVLLARDSEARVIIVLHVLPRGRAYRG